MTTAAEFSNCWSRATRASTMSPRASSVPRTMSILRRCAGLIMWIHSRFRSRSLVPPWTNRPGVSGFWRSRLIAQLCASYMPPSGRPCEPARPRHHESQDRSADPGGPDDPAVTAVGRRRLAQRQGNRTGYGRRAGRGAQRGPRRSTIEFVTPERVTYRPELGVLYPSELSPGMRIYVEYDKSNPDLVRVQGRNASLSIIPAGSIIVVVWTVTGTVLLGLAWLRRRGPAPAHA